MGRVCQIWFDPIQLAFDSNMTLVRPKDKYMEYVGSFLYTKQQYFVQMSQGSTNQTRLYCSMIRPLDIVIPTEEVAIEFGKKINPIKTYIQLLQAENKQNELILLLALYNLN